MIADTIQKYRKRSTANLKLQAIKVFNAWIRKRDELAGCITCGSFTEIQAGHYHAAGQNNHLRFNEDNVNSQCKRCNYYLRGAQAKYRMNLIHKIGVERVERLDQMAADRGVHKTDRFFIIEVIEKYNHAA